MPCSLARQLLKTSYLAALLLIVATIFSGCLLPQDEYYIEDLPTIRNNPPSIVESQVTPPGHALTVSSADPCSVSFTLKVQDPDVLDRLYYRFYIDYVFPTVLNPAPNNPIFKEGIIEPSPTREEVRNDSVTFETLDPTHTIFTIGSHVVEALVTDSRISDRTDTVAEDGERQIGKAFYTWLVNVTGTCQ
jgi:hypothetical protein